MKKFEVKKFEILTKRTEKTAFRTVFNRKTFGNSKKLLHIYAKEFMNKVKKRLDALTSQILANPALGKDDAIISELRGLRELLQTWRAFYAVQGQYSDDLPEGPRQVREASQTWD